MRFPSWLLAVLASTFPALAHAQTVKPADLFGTWKGKVEYEYDSTQAPPTRETGINWLALWRDGLFHFSGGSSRHGHGSGRWRLSGDTLWLGNDWRYGNGAVNMRGGILQADTLDTLRMPAFPHNDSLFWTHTPAERTRLANQQGGSGYWFLTAYKISLQDGRLTIVRFDSLSNSRWHPARGVYEHRPNDPVPW